MDEISPIAPSSVVIPGVLPEYAELQCVSNFSFLRGASHPEELVERAAQLDYRALAITDECSLAGVVRAHVEAKKHTLQLLIGSQFQLHDADGSPVFSLIALAQNREGYGNLSELITLARSRAGKGHYLLRPQDLDNPDADHAHLRQLPDCLLILLPTQNITHDTLARQAAWLHINFPGRCWIGLTLLHQAGDEQQRAVIEQVAQMQGLPIVATGDVCMHRRSRKPLQDTMTAIRIGKPVTACGYALAPNAEQHLRARLRLANLYPAAALAATVEIAGKCHFSLDELRYEYPDEVVPAGHTAASYLRQQTYIGARKRYADEIPAAVQNQLEDELEIIHALQYESYFLTVYDIVEFARRKSILCQGRGSAANSAVCYCLGITEVDPSRSTLLFGRFISKERDEPPDIDVDFEHQRREEVIQYIYEKYGRRRAALTAVVISYRPRSVLRDVGKALGVDPGLVDQVAKSQRWWDDKQQLQQNFSELGIAPGTAIAEHWAGLSHTLMGFPRHLSQHPGGFVISRGKLSRLVPIENAAMENRSVVQWDKDDLDALRILKVDVLALGMLSMLQRALAMVAFQRGEVFEMQDIPREDPVTYEMICKADTIGVFQIESRAQMSMLPRLKPRKFYDLVIQVAIVRPGPIQGGMVHPFLKNRKLNKEDIVYPKDALKPALERTLGIPIFQEQVMQIAVIAAGFTQGEADELRRSMAAWKRKGGLEKFERKLIDGMVAKDYDESFARAIFSQIQGFGEYGFPESHAASFALLAYASSWLKCHEPEAFLAALLNSQPMGFYSPSQLVQDARRHGVDVLPVDINVSNWEATLESTAAARPAVRLGLNLVRGLRFENAEEIEAARAVRPFGDLQDMALRSGLRRDQLQALAAAGSLAPLSGNRRQALWQALVSAPEKGLLRQTQVHEEELQLTPPGEAENIVSDYHTLGLTLGRHPLALLRAKLSAKRFLPADVLNTFANGQLARGCGIVTVRQRPGTAKGVVFVTLEDETGTVNVVVWPDLADLQRKELRAATLMGVYGVWQTQDGVSHLVAKRLLDLSPLLGKLDTSSRDFH
ncbi:DNA polymerase III alpha subunit [Collimonas arenae]|uniref:Error-prone DNA polymerase n=1 Tax=Collimonas arenae TaxID=279058 RepID=A0A0A1FBJ9_9BURK|nr:error-prone DNA polymerase [Collimonas arenae]AIY41135.1 DNA polymerase III alpha subunit [Collimonas arenae]